MPNAWTGSGRGRKQCEHCGIYYASRAACCSRCGKRPNIKKQLPRKKNVKKEVVETKTGDDREWLIVPSGSPPFPITGYDRASVHDWARKVVDKIEGEGKYRVAEDALLYWMSVAYAGEERAVTLKIGLHYLRQWNKLYRDDGKEQ